MINIHIEIPDDMFSSVHQVFESALSSVSDDMLYPNDSIKYVLSFVRQPCSDPESELPF